MLSRGRGAEWAQVVALGLGLVVALSACYSRGSADTSPAKTRDEIHVVTYALEIAGALALEVERPGVDVRELSVNDDRFPETRVLSMGSDWIPWDDMQVAVLFSFMGYRGNGDYEIPPTSEAASERGGGPDVSEVVVKYRRGTDETTESAFSQRLSPCAVEIRDEAAAGQLRCERVGDGTGRVVSINARWWT